MPQHATSNYLSVSGTGGITATTATAGSYTTIDQLIEWNAPNGVISGKLIQKTGISPQLFFKYIKSKFGIIEGIKLNARLKRVEKAFNKAVENGQIFLGEKLMADLIRETRESALYAKGIKHFIEYDDLIKHKRNIRGGHISDTKFHEFTRVIPDDVLAKKKKVESVFDGFVIYHFWDEEGEKKKAKGQQVTERERQNMRDPVLFGVIRESNRLYFVADWEDEFCDLTFEELIDVIGGDDEKHTITREPRI